MAIILKILTPTPISDLERSILGPLFLFREHVDPESQVHQFYHHNSRSYMQDIRRGVSYGKARRLHPYHEVIVNLMPVKFEVSEPGLKEITDELQTNFQYIVHDQGLVERQTKNPVPEVYYADKGLSLLKYFIVLNSGFSNPLGPSFSERAIGLANDLLASLYLPLGLVPEYNFGKEIIAHFAKSKIPFYAIASTDGKSYSDAKSYLLCENSPANIFTSYGNRLPSRIRGLIPKLEQAEADS